MENAKHNHCDKDCHESVAVPLSALRTTDKLIHIDHIEEELVSDRAKKQNAKAKVGKISKQRSGDSEPLTTDRKNQTSCNTLEDKAIIKEFVFVSEEKEKTGPEWIITIIVRVLSTLNETAIEAERQYFVKRLRYIWNTLCYLCLTAYYIWFSITSGLSMENATYFVVVILIIICIIQIMLISIDVYCVMIMREIDTYKLSSYGIFIWILIFGLSSYILSGPIFDNNWIAWSVIAVILSLNLVIFLSIVFWIIALPLILLGIGIEVTVRCLIGKTDCPLEINKVITYKYKLFRFDKNKFKECASCSICLEEYKESDVTLCILNCQKSHVFHEKCIFDWIKVRRDCPICRAEIQFMQ